jgi:hypothetical protein
MGDLTFLALDYMLHSLWSNSGELNTSDQSCGKLQLQAWPLGKIARCLATSVKVFPVERRYSCSLEGPSDSRDARFGKTSSVVKQHHNFTM